jgi:hypothetical protein
MNQTVVENLVRHGIQLASATIVEEKKGHWRLNLNGTMLSVHWPPGTTDVQRLDFLVDLGALDPARREAQLEALLSANLALYAEGRSMLALDHASDHGIYATAMPLDEWTEARELANTICGLDALCKALSAEIRSASNP